MSAFTEEEKKNIKAFIELYDSQYKGKYMSWTRDTAEPIRLVMYMKMHKMGFKPGVNRFPQGEVH